MNFRGNRNTKFEIFSNSFSDIMFFLMLFFLIASTMIVPGNIKLLLPKANHSESIKRPPKEVSISITKDLNYFFNNQPVKFTDIEPMINKEKGDSTDLLVVVRCDNTINVQNLVDVMQIGSSTGVKMVLATTRNEEM